MDPAALGCPVQALDGNRWVQQTRDHRESPFRVALAGALDLHFAIEPTYTVWVGGTWPDSPCAPEKRRAREEIGTHRKLEVWEGF